MAEATSTKLINDDDRFANHQMQTIIDEANVIRDSGEGSVVKAMAMSKAMTELKKLFTDHMLDLVLGLKDSELGFKTDKDYTKGVLKEALLLGMLQGGYPVNNEINVIAGKPYLTKNYFTRALFELPGLTDLKIQFGEVTNVTGGARVEAIATWKFQGVADTIEAVKGDKLDGRILVKLNAGMGTDGAIGKAERKLKAAIYRRVTGCTFTDAEEVDGGGPPATQ